MEYYKKEDVDRFLQKHNIYLKYGDLKEYWAPIIRIQQVFATGPSNIIPTIYYNGNCLNEGVSAWPLNSEDLKSKIKE